MFWMPVPGPAKTSFYDKLPLIGMAFLARMIPTRQTATSNGGIDPNPMIVGHRTGM